MTAPTHLAFGLCIHLLIMVTMRCLNASWSAILVTLVASLLPDFDTPRSIIGFLIQRIVRIASFGRIDLSHMKHRGFSHSLPCLMLFCLILLPLRRDFLPYFILGFLSHLLADSFQKSGIRLLGFTNHWMRFSLKTSIPMRSDGEYAFLGSSLLVVALCAFIIAQGGASAMICKVLGTVRATSESIAAWQDYRLTLVVTSGGDGKAEEEYDVVDVLGNDAIILSMNGVPVKYGYSDTCQLRAQGRKSYAVRHEKVTRVAYPFVLKDEPLSSLYSRIEQAYPYYVSGCALLEKSVSLPSFYNRFNTVEAEGRRLNFRYARLDDLKIYHIENNLVGTGDFTVTYQVPQGQDVSGLQAKVKGEASEDVVRIQKRIAELERLKDADVKELLGVSEEEAAVYQRLFRKTIAALLEEEKVNLLRLQSIRRE